MNDEITLCIGVYASLMNLCRDQSRISNQAEFVMKLIAILDPNNSLVPITNSLKGNGTVSDIAPSVSKLLRCKLNLSVNRTPDQIMNDRKTIVENMRLFIAQYMDRDKIPGLIVSLVSIIRNDSYINRYSKELFKSIFGCYVNQLNFDDNKIVVYEFLSSLLIYSALNEKVKNTSCAESVAKISEEYIYALYAPYENDLSYDADTQTLSLVCCEIYDSFWSILQKNHIDAFLNIDTSLCTYDVCFDWCDSFAKEIDTQILQVYPGSSIMLQKVIDFCNVLHEYDHFLITNTAFRCDKTLCINDEIKRISNNSLDYSEFVYSKNPLYYHKFADKVRNYRNECKEKYGEIVIYLSFFIFE